MSWIMAGDVLNICLQRAKGVQTIAAEAKLNKQQCTHLSHKLLQLMEWVQDLTRGFKVHKFGLVCEELSQVVNKVGWLVQECAKENWWYVAAMQLDNREAFRELLEDMDFCHGTICDMLKSAYPNAHDIFCEAMEFHPASLRQVAEDRQSLEEMLKLIIEDVGSELQIQTLAKYLQDRLHCLQLSEGESVDNAIFPNCFEQQTCESQLGSGSFGEVQKVRWMNMDCAMKVFPKSDHSNLEETTSFHCKEMGILSNLSHPNLTKFIGCGIEGNQHETSFVLMELMDNNLAETLNEDNEPMTYLVAIDIMLQIANGMYYLHDMHVAHRDLKPENVLVTMIHGKCGVNRYEFVKLADVGISKIEVGREVEVPNQIYGSSIYIAPEACIRNSSRPIHVFKADVYSFAMTCCAILLKETPFEHDERSRDVLKKSIESGERPKLPTNCDGLRLFIQDCWHVNPSKRPTFSEICTRLKELKQKFLVGVYEDDVPNYCTTFFYDIIQGCKSTTLKLFKNQTMEVNESNIPKVSKSSFHLQEMVQRTSRRLQDVSSIGIVGMGGIGESTLAMEVFKNVQHNYQASCFVRDLTSKKDNPIQVMEDMLAQLGESNPKLKGVKDGQVKLKEILTTKKVLIVLDDVASQEQVAILLPIDSLSVDKGSKLIMCSRNWGALNVHVLEVGKIEVELLENDVPLKLFITYAFDNNECPKQFVEIAMEVTKACNGLPLSLSIMGSHLRGKERLRSWELSLQRLHKAKSLRGGETEMLWRILKISFNDLLDKEKCMFLDICCFACKDVCSGGMSETLALQIWGGGDTNDVEALENLMHSSLIKVDEDGVLEIHDQLRDMGRGIAKREFGRTRLWNTSMASLVACTNQDIQKIEVLVDQGSYHGRYDDGSIEDVIFSHLRLLRIQNCYQQTWIHILTQHQKGLGPFPCLTFLHLYECNVLKTLPNKISKMNRLAILFMEGCKGLTTLPEELGNLTTLTTLHLLRCTGLMTLPDGLGKLTGLTSLDLSGCKRLMTLPEGLDTLTGLTRLDLSGCKRLTTLPKGLGKLTGLTNLHLSTCEGLTTLPEGLGKLTGLTSLHLSTCEGLTTLPEVLGNLTGLSSLNLWWCKGLTTLSEGLGKLTGLTRLDLSRCGGLTTLPEGLGNLTGLTSLGLWGCERLMMLPEGLGNLTGLTSLDLWQDKGLTTLPEGLGKLTGLTGLDLSGCKGLTTLPEGLGKLTNLTSLNLSGCRGLTTLPEDLGKLTTLTTLHLISCIGFQTLSEGLGKLTGLTTLKLSWCNGLTMLPEGLGKLIGLTRLDLQDCGGLTSLPEGLGTRTGLISLNLSRCGGLTTLPEGMGKLTGLTSLNLSGCGGLTTLSEGSGTLTGLISLNLSRCGGLTTLPEWLGKLTGLTGLDLSGCKGLTTLPEGLGKLTGLTRLDLQDCGGLTTLPQGLGELTGLTCLNLFGCKGLTTLPEWLGKLTGLTRLHLSECGGLLKLPEGLGKLTGLTRLDLQDCGGLTTLPQGLGELTGLTCLNLFGCKGLTTLPEWLGKLTGLTRLRLSECGGLLKLPEGLGKLTGLISLDLSECKGLTTLPEGLGKLTSLTYLHLSGCEGLMTLPEGLDKLIGLTSLDLSGYGELTTLSERLGKLTGLIDLYLSGCEGLTTLPEGLGKLTGLASLSLFECEGLKTLSEGLGKLTGLTSLYLSRCEGLTTLPEGLGKLTGLASLDLSGCEGLTTLPEGLGKLIGLTHLDLSGCKGLTTLPEGFSKLTGLTTLFLSKCEGLTTLPEGLGNLTGLTSLDLWQDKGLTTLPEGLGKLTGLTRLGLKECGGLTTLPEGLGKLIGLIHLDLSGCKGLTTLPEGFSKLTGMSSKLMYIHLL